VHHLSLLALIPVILLAACGSDGSSGGDGPTKVTIALDWVPNTNHTGVFVAQERGWYRDEKLDVEILPYSQGSPPDVQVAAGRADFGFSFEESVAVARAARQPVVSLAAVIQRNSSALVTLKDSGLERPAALNGKRYAGFGAPFEEPVIDAIIACDGVASPGFENVTANTFGFEALLAKQADFVWIFLGWEGIAAQRRNVQLNQFPPTSYCIPNYYTPVIVTNERMTRERADVVRRFMRAPI
jgi:ABC-type nitrate/sulfonate/bicarbonate transport system substrate-binding protein